MDTPIIQVAVGVPFSLRVNIENPLDIPVTLKNLELHNCGLEIKAEIISEVVLPPLSKKSIFTICLNVHFYYYWCS
jgi:hypothetical protein